MTYAFTVFNSPRWWDKQKRYVYDNKTHRRVNINGGWKSFVDFFYKLSERQLASKQDAELISPAIFKPDSTRKNENVIEWASWAAVDVDDLEYNGDLYTYLVEQFGHYNWICYSTASSTETLPKFRLVFPLTKAVPNEQIKSFWYALQSELGDLGDKQTKDLSRMYYVPAQYSGANNFIYDYNKGNPVDPDELIFKYPMAQKATLNNFFDRLPEEMQKQIIEHRKSKLDNASIFWTSYKDCPFFPRKLEAEYRMISKTGWYRKMYQIMVAIAGNAVKKNYPITSAEISQLCRELDLDTGNWYENRPMDREADGAIEFIYRNL